VTPRRSLGEHAAPGDADDVSDPASLLWRLEGTGCTACNARREAGASSVGWFLRENYHEAATLTALIHRRFCGPHLAMLLASRDPHLGVTLEFLARRQVATLEGFRQGLRRRWRAPWSFAFQRGRRLPAEAQPVDRPDRCQFCAAGSAAAVVAVADVVELLHDGRGRSAYQASDGLCGPHAWIALREAPKEVSDWLAEDMQGRLRTAEAEIDSWYASLRGGASGDFRTQAWARAAHLLWGGVAEPGARMR
jgi:hypothetical protein